MGKSIDIDVNSIARNVKQPFVGVEGTARKVVKGYVGVDGVAREFYSGDWWGSNCLAAYKFKNAGSQTQALTDLTGHGYTLSTINNPAWNNSNGYTINQYSRHALHNDALYNASPSSAVFCLDSAQSLSNSAMTVSGCKNGSYTRCLFLLTPYTSINHVYGNRWWQTTPYIGAYMRNGSDSSSVNLLKMTNVSPSTGKTILGITWLSSSTCSIFINGVQYESTGPVGEPTAAPIDGYTIRTAENAALYSENSKIIGSITNKHGEWGNGTCNSNAQYVISYAAFYSAALTNTQHRGIYNSLINQ